MNYWKHSLLSKKKFGGQAEDYLSIHKFLDSSKLFFFDIRHRILLHHTYGIDLCIGKFGDMLSNTDGQKILVRDIAAEHCREDLMGAVPSLNNWFKFADPALLEALRIVKPADTRLREFVLRPLLMSGLEATLIITHSNFGIYLIKECLGPDYALEFARHLQPLSINEWLPKIRLSERWQYAPDLHQLKKIDNEFF